MLGSFIFCTSWPVGRSTSLIVGLLHHFTPQYFYLFAFSSWFFFCMYNFSCFHTILSILFFFLIYKSIYTFVMPFLQRSGSFMLDAGFAFMIRWHFGAATAWC